MACPKVLNKTVAADDDPPTGPSRDALCTIRPAHINTKAGDSLKFRYTTITRFCIDLQNITHIAIDPSKHDPYTVASV